MNGKLENSSCLINAQISQYDVIENHCLNKIEWFNQALLKEILGSITLPRYFLAGRFKDLYITKREAECIICLAWGYTMKQTAKILKVSDRTVESFRNNIKTKLNCYDKAQLIEAAIECGFLECIRPKV